LRPARLHYHRQLLADGGNALVDQAPVGFNLCLAGAAHKPEAAALSLEVGPRPHQATLLIVEVGKFHLQAAFTRSRALAEDFQDEARAIEHLASPGLLQVALLHRGHGVIDDGESGPFIGDQLAELGNLAWAEERRGPGLWQRHRPGDRDIEIYRPRQAFRFRQPIVQRVLGG
jgi:hypothetical protein